MLCHSVLATISGVICRIKATGEKLCRSLLIILNQFCDCELRSLPSGLWDMMPLTPPLHHRSADLQNMDGLQMRFISR